MFQEFRGGEKRKKLTKEKKKPTGPRQPEPELPDGRRTSPCAKGERGGFACDKNKKKKGTHPREPNGNGRKEKSIDPKIAKIGGGGVDLHKKRKKIG